MLYDGGDPCFVNSLGVLCSMQLLRSNVAYLDLLRCLAGCPLCMREVNMLKRRDEGKGRIYFVDIDAPDYRPEDNAGITYEQVHCGYGRMPRFSRFRFPQSFLDCMQYLETLGLLWV